MNRPEGSPPTGSFGRSFDSLIVRVRNGDNDAATDLLSEYGPHIIRVIRRRMNAKLRERFDSQDFTQAVWASFFGNLDAVTRLRDSAELILFLSRVASNKVIDAGRRSQVSAEMRLSERSPSEARDHLPLVETTQPTPSQHAIAQESLDRIVRDEGETERHIVDCRRRGMTQQEIAAEMGTSERQIRRILSRLARKMPPRPSDES